MARPTRLPDIQIRDDGYGFTLLAPAEALIQLADLFAEALRVEVTPGDGSVIVVRRADDGPVTMRHEGLNVEIVGGRDVLDNFADTLRVVAAGPTVPSSIPYHAHVEHFPGHLWLAANSEPIVVHLLPD